MIKRNRKEGKKLLAALLSMALLLTAMPVSAFGAEAAEEPAAAVETPAEAEEEIVEIGDPEEAEAVAAPAEEAGEPAVLSENEAEVISANEAETEEAASAEVGTIEINQGFSYHTGLNDGNEVYLTTFVAKKKTAVMMKIPESDSMTEDQAKEAVKNYKLEAKAVTNGQEADNNELEAGGDSFVVKRVYDKDCDLVAGWYAIANFPTGPDKGTYNFHLKNGDTEIGKHEGVTFYETRNLNILVVPVNAYWSKKYDGGAPADATVCSVKNGKFSDNEGNEKEWSELIPALKEYMLDVYPIADVTFEEGQEVQANDASYDMCNEADQNGQKKLWEEVCKLQSKTKDGKDRYDLILAFVQYRQDQGAGQGYTFGKPTNIITYSDKDMLPTVAHEIAHCYQVGDEYNGGSFNTNVNMPPNGYNGRNFVTGENITGTSGANDYWKDSKGVKAAVSDADKKNKINENGAGTMVSPGLRTYSLSKQEFIRWAGVDAEGKASGTEVFPTISWMGSGYSGSEGYYFTSSVIWDHLLKELVVKEKKEASSEQEQSSEGEQSNAQVFENAVKSGAQINEYSIFDDEDDFYFDDDYRFGESRMVEVNGWLKNEGGSVKVSQMNPMFSYDGDLETIDVLEDVYKGSKDVYSFAAVDKDENIITSPVDGRPASVSFNGSFFNPRSGKGGKNLEEVNFNFDAEYPEGTKDFIIIAGQIDAKGGYDKSKVIWKAKRDAKLTDEDFEKKVDSFLDFAEVNDKTAEVEWEVYYPEDAEEPYDNKDGKLYTEVYYCPEGDDGEAYYVGCSKDKNWTEGSVKFNTTDYKTKWTRNAYVWIKVTNGVNAVDIYSDENDVTLCNSTITLTGAGIKAETSGNEKTYYAMYTGKPIVPNTSVKARDPETGKYIPLTKDVDYTVTYKDNTAVGFASVIVQGIGTYAGKNTQEFEIRKKSFENAVPDSIPDITWNKEWSASENALKKLDSFVRGYISATDNAGNALINDTDFTVKFTVSGNTDKTLSKLVKGEPAKGSSVSVKVTYRGKGCYEGTCKKSVTFEIFSSEDGKTMISESNAEITLKASTFQYTGKPIKPAIKSVYVSGNEGRKKLKSSQYKVVYSGNTYVGTGRVKIIGKNGYTGSSFVTFTIEPKKVTSLSVKGLKNQPYTGKAVSVNELPLVVKAGGITLTKDVDYRVVSVNGCDYTNVTKKGDKKPQLKIELLEKKAGAKNSQTPKVVWKNGSKEVVKSFAIIQTKLNSAAVTFSTSSNVSANNPIKDPEGKTVIGTIRAATKDELNTGKRKYTYVIEGAGESLSKNAVISSGTSIKAYGVELDPKLYTVSVTKTKDGKIGTITYKAKRGTDFSGTKKIKFKYICNAKD